jgi:hypothetical protein
VHVISDTHSDQSLTGTYGHLTVEYRRLAWTWTVTVWAGPTRIEELCGTYDQAMPAYREAQRIALAAHNGHHVDDIIATKPSELVLAEVRNILNTLPAAEPRQVRGTMAHAHLAPLQPAQIRAIRTAAANPNHTVHVGEEIRPTLKAIARKGLGTLNYQPGLGRRRVIESLTLNARGLAQAEQEKATV